MEKKVLAFVAPGQSNAEITTTAGLVEETVQDRLRRLRSKLGTSSRVRLVGTAHWETRIWRLLSEMGSSGRVHCVGLGWRWRPLADREGA
ncbi:LuxR C-terminal-related transcriptional regulator [Streptomyces sp. NPDC050636]|uniref:LuxR C-terminal-related transcriptional regulator n=1 Tax=Streptomyces sp. NPDC050636 TaxID=3154510 RepID=UPI00342372B3